MGGLVGSQYLVHTAVADWDRIARNWQPLSSTIPPKQLLALDEVPLKDILIGPHGDVHSLVFATVDEFRSMDRDGFVVSRVVSANAMDCIPTVAQPHPL